MECSRSHHNNWAKDRKNYPGEAGHPGIYYLPSKYNMHHSLSLFPLKLKIMYTNLHHCTFTGIFFFVYLFIYWIDLIINFIYLTQETTQTIRDMLSCFWVCVFFLSMLFQSRRGGDGINIVNKTNKK